MQNINGYWVDANNNKWDTNLYTQDEAERMSDTLIDCSGCSDCRDCSGCSGCSDCRDLYNAHDYISQPKMYTTQRTGSRKGITYFYLGQTAKGISLQVVCGCFKGDLREFEQAVAKTHGDNKHGAAYKAEIAKVKALWDLED